MDSPALPAAAFVAPDGSNRDQVEALLGEGLRRVLDRAAGAGAAPPMPEATALPAGDLLPAAPVPERDILSGLEQLMAGSMNQANPGYMGHMDPMPATASLLGALATAALNNNMLSLEMSPALSRLEVDLMAALARLFGLPEGAGGVMTGGGSLANILALAVARNRAFDVARGGLAGISRRPVVLASESVHASVPKALMVLGLGSDSLIKVPSDENDRLAPDGLAKALAAARAAGDRPFAVVATAGTTVTGNIDPLAEVGALAHGEGLWFHVDAAYGGALAVGGRTRALLTGIEQADSLTFNPQKWLYVARTCACCLFRDRGELERRFRVAAPYMAETDFTNLGELGLQGTRPTEVLKLWATLQHIGLDALAALVERQLALTREVLRRVETRPLLELAARPDTNLLCFRAAPEDKAPEAQDALTEALQRHLLSEGLFLSLPLFRGRRWLRLVLLNPYSGEPEIDRLFAAIDEFFARSSGRP